MTAYNGGRWLTEVPGALPADVDERRRLARAAEPGYREEDDEISLVELWLTISKYRWTIVAFALLVLVTTVVGTFLMRPVYRATATVLIDEDRPKILEYEDFQSSPASATASRSFYETQYQILRSRSLARSVIDELGLMQTPEIGGELEQRGLLTGIRQLLRFATAETEPPTAEQRQAAAIDRFLDRLEISPVRGSKLVQVSFDSFEPVLAAKVVNTLIESYTRENLRRRYEAGTQAREFLAGQLAEMQARIERADRALQDFASKHNVADLDMRTELVTDKLAELEQARSALAQRQAALEVKYRRIRAGAGDTLPEVVNSQLIGTLQEELIERRAEYSELSGQLKPQYPRMVQLRARIEQLEEQIAAEKRRIQDSIVAQYEGAVQEQAALAELAAREEAALQALKERSVQYNILKREFETNKELYDGLLQRMKEIGVAAGVRENNVAVIDAAKKPLEPFKPKMGFNVALALLLGTLGGTGLAFLLRFLDNTVGQPEELEAMVGLPSLGIVPWERQGHGRRAAELPPAKLACYSVHDTRSALSEAFRSLRTSLMYSSPEGMPKILAVTSPSAGEGKTTTACNPACVLAQSGKRILLIDGDLRKGRLHRYFEKAQVPGLTQCIAHRNVPPTTHVHTTSVSNLCLLTTGTLPPNPAELLAPEALSGVLDALAECFDHVVIDSAPVMGLADALVLSRSVNGVVVVAAAGKTTRHALQYAVQRLRQVHAGLLGVVLNKVDVDSPEYHYYYAYGYYGHPAAEKALVDDPDRRQLTTSDVA